MHTTINKSLVIAIIAGIAASIAAGLLVYDTNATVAKISSDRAMSAKGFVKDMDMELSSKDYGLNGNRVIAAIPVKEFDSLAEVAKPGGKINIIAGNALDNSIPARTILKDVSIVDVPKVNKSSPSIGKRCLLVSLTVEESERLAAWINDPSLLVVVSK